MSKRKPEDYKQVEAPKRLKLVKQPECTIANCPHRPNGVILTRQCAGRHKICASCALKVVQGGFEGTRYSWTMNGLPSMETKFTDEALNCQQCWDQVEENGPRNLQDVTPALKWLCSLSSDVSSLLGALHPLENLLVIFQTFFLVPLLKFLEAVDDGTPDHKCQLCDYTGTLTDVQRHILAKDSSERHLFECPGWQVNCKACGVPRRFTTDPQCAQDGLEVCRHNDRSDLYISMRQAMDFIENKIDAHWTAQGSPLMNQQMAMMTRCFKAICCSSSSSLPFDPQNIINSMQSVLPLPPLPADCQAFLDNHHRNNSSSSSSASMDTSSSHQPQEPSASQQQQQQPSMPTPTPYHYGTTSAELSATAEAKVPETPQHDGGGEEQEQFNTQLNKMAVDLTNMIGVLPQKSPVKDPLHRFSATGKQNKPRHLVWATTQQQQVTTTMTTLSREASDG